MLNPWISLGMKVWQIGFEAQIVIALGMLRLAAGELGCVMGILLKSAIRLK
ncbi:MAG TPA: hypothetical protein VGZ25_10355 [Gemmataceae bacterium]|jgi:hypothetical protein|nr:hypothetical protein [Gemmataceae bacterium]